MDISVRILATEIFICKNFKKEGEKLGYLGNI